MAQQPDKIRVHHMKRRSSSRATLGRTSAPSTPVTQERSQLEQTIKDLNRDNQVLRAELEKVKSTQSRKAKNLQSEKEMRLKANKDRYWLKQKLSKMQMAIQARLKMLGIDFSSIEDIGEALDAAFSAIQKLSAELAAKEKEVEGWSARYEHLEREHAKLQRQLERIQGKFEEQKDDSAALRRQLQERDQQLMESRRATEKQDRTSQSLEAQIEELKKKLKSQRKKQDAQYEKFMEQKEALEEELKETQDDLDDKTRLLEASERDNAKLKELLEKTRALLKQANRDKDRLANDLGNLRAQSEKQAASDRDTIKELQAALAAEREAKEQLEADLRSANDKIMDYEDTIAIQDEEIADYKRERDVHADKSLRLEKLKNASESELSNAVARLSDEKERLLMLAKKLSDQNRNKDEELQQLRRQLADTKKRLNDWLNRPRDDKSTQTDLDGNWFDKNEIKLADYNRVKDEVAHLHQVASELDGKVRALVDENKVLIDEIDYLLKNAAKFRPDSSNHTGKVLALEASPARMICATTATDKSVRLWRVDPEASGKRQCQVYVSANMEGEALSLAFSKDGTYLAAGTAYKSGPEGAILVWDITKGDGEVEFLFRSRPTVRFGRVHCLTWSTDNRYIFNGDTTGCVWVWDIQHQLQLAEVNMHGDVVHDLGAGPDFLFSCAHDQTIAMFELARLAKVKINPDKLHRWKPKKAKAKTLGKNEKYPYWCVQPSEDARFLVAGSRKLYIFTWDGQELGKGPRVTDPDLDHISAIQCRRHMIAICRNGVPRLKVYDINSGREVKRAQFKKPVSKVGFLCDLNHVVAVIQVWDKGQHEPPMMRLHRLEDN